MTLIIEDGQADEPPRSKVQALWRGFIGRCPQCGEGHLFRAFLKVNDYCPVCREELHHQRADDAPPYITMFVVCHIIIALVVAVEMVWSDAPWWLEVIVWSVMTIGLSLLLLPRVKGALVALQWSLRMHGFGGPEVVDRANMPI